MPEDRSTVQNAIWGAHPARLVPAAREAIESWLGAEGAEILLIDYHQSHLIPFADGGGGVPVPVGSHSAGRAYASGRPVEEDDHLYLPLIVYGERTGVLAVRLPAGSTASQEDLEAVAASLAAPRPGDAIVLTKPLGTGVLAFCRGGESIHERSCHAGRSRCR